MLLVQRRSVIGALVDEQDGGSYKVKVGPRRLHGSEERLKPLDEGGDQLEAGATAIVEEPAQKRKK